MEGVLLFRYYHHHAAAAAAAATTTTTPLLVNVSPDRLHPVIRHHFIAPTPSIVVELYAHGLRFSLSTIYIFTIIVILTLVLG